MTPEMLVFLHRPLRPSMNYLKQNGGDKGIPPSNSEMILLFMSDAINVEPDMDECVPANFCDNV